MKDMKSTLGLLVAPLALVALACAAGAAPQADAPAPPERGGVAVAEELAPQDRHPRVDFTVPCQDCHRRSDPEVVRDWEESLHGQQDVGCVVCHGDGQVHFEARPGDEHCATCHSATIADPQHAPVDRCFSCHDAHRLMF